jgi:hypothetical protein
MTSTSGTTANTPRFHRIDIVARQKRSGRGDPAIFVFPVCSCESAAPSGLFHKLDKNRAVADLLALSGYVGN